MSLASIGVESAAAARRSRDGRSGLTARQTPRSPQPGEGVASRTAVRTRNSSSEAQKTAWKSRPAAKEYGARPRRSGANPRFRPAVPWFRSTPPDIRTRRTKLAMSSRPPSTGRNGLVRPRSRPSGRPRPVSVTASAGPAEGAVGSDPSTGAESAESTEDDGHGRPISPVPRQARESGRRTGGGRTT